MINHQDRHRIGKARLLRRQGKTYDEIRAVIGWVRDEQLARWLRAIPRPPETRRGKAQDGLRRRCRQLRSSGRTYDEIAEITGASMGSLSLWLGDMPRDFDGAKERRLARLRATCGRSREERLRQRESLVASWLTLVGVSGERCRFRVAIHETADVCRAESFWADLVRVDPTIFSKATIKRHRPNTVRYNTGDDYYGCLVVDVLKSAELYRFVAGWWRGVSCGQQEAPSLAEPLG